MKKNEEKLLKSISELIEVRNGKKCILNSKLEALNLDKKERKIFLEFLNLMSLPIEYDTSLEEKTRKEDRSKLVRDFEYGSVILNGGHHNDVPTVSEIELTEEDEIMYSDYKSLEQLLDKKIIPLVKVKIRGNNGVPYDSVQLNQLLKLQLSQLELGYAINYLGSKGICVSGIDSTLEGEFDSYKKVSTYRYINGGKRKALNKEQNFKLFKAYEETRNPKVRESIIEGNIPLVRKSLLGLICVLDMPDEELLLYGYEALIYAVDHFNCNLGYVFSTYAHKVIYFKTLSLLRNDRVLKPSDKFLDAIDARSIIAEEKYIKEEEVSPEEIVSIIEKVRGKTFQNKYRQYFVNAVGLQFCSYFEDWVTPDTFIDYDEIMENSAMYLCLKHELADVLNTLTDLEQQVLCLRFGLEDGKELSLEKVGKIIGRSRERVRQIEAKALRKMRHPSRSRRFKGFLD